MLLLFITRKEKNIEYGWIIQESKEHGPFPNLNYGKFSENQYSKPSVAPTTMGSNHRERQFQLFSINEVSSNTNTRIISKPTKFISIPSHSVNFVTNPNQGNVSLAIDDSSRLKRLIDSHPEDPNMYLLRIKDFLQTQSDRLPSSLYLEETSLSAIWQRQRASILYSCPRNVKSYMFCQRHWIVTWDSESRKFAHYTEQPGNHLRYFF